MDLPSPTALARRDEFSRVYREEFAFAWRTLLRLGVPPLDCDDAVQDVFVVAHRRWETLREPEKRRAWLGGIVRRIAWRYRRTLRRRRRRLDALEHAPSPTLELEEELARREAWRSLASFLDDLDEPKRDAFVLGELEALGRLELGAALGVNPNTAYSRLVSARRSFVTHFGALDDDGCAEMLTRAKVATEPTEPACARGRAGLVAILGTPVRVTSSVIASWAAAAVVVLAAVGTMVALRDTSSSAPLPSAVAPVETRTPSSSTASAPTTAIPLALPPTQVARAEPETMAPTHARPRDEPSRGRPSATRAANEGDALDAEVATLVRAREALVAGDMHAVRRHLDAHRRQFGDAGTLAELRAEIERELVDTASITRVGAGDRSRSEPPR